MEKEENAENTEKKIRPRTLCQMFVSDNNRQTSSKGSLPEDYEIQVPKYEDCKKDFPSKTKKPMKITEEFCLHHNIGRDYIEEVPKQEQRINFDSLLYQFKSPDEIKELQVIDIFDIDSEKMNSIQEKCADLINILSYKIEGESKNEGESCTEQEIEESNADTKFMEYLVEQSNSLKTNKMNLDIITANIEKIKEFRFNSNGVQVFFKDKYFQKKP